jgi:hypothetical protein
MKKIKVNGCIKMYVIIPQGSCNQQRNGTLFFRKIFLKARTDLSNSAVMYPLYLADSPLLISTLVGAEWTASRPEG